MELKSVEEGVMKELDKDFVSITINIESCELLRCECDNDS